MTLNNSRCSSSFSLLRWWLELDHVRTELQVVTLRIFVLFILLDLPVFHGKFLHLLFVFGLCAHFGLVLLLVLLDHFLLGTFLRSHSLHLNSHDCLIDESGPFHQNIEVVAGKCVDLVIHERVTECFDQLDNDSGWLQRQQLLLNGFVGFLENSELVLGWIFQNILNELQKDTKAIDDLGIFIAAQDVI